MAKKIYHSTGRLGVVYYESEVRRHNGRPDKCYYIRYSKNGKSKREKIGWASDGYSVAFAAKKRSIAISKADRNEYDISVTDLIVKYIEWAKNNKSSWKEDVQMLGPFKSYFHGFCISDISPEDIESYVDEIRLRKARHIGEDGKVHDVPIKPSRVRHYLNIARRVINYAIDTKLYSGINPAEKIKVHVPDNTVIGYMYPDEIKRLIAYCTSGKTRLNCGEIILFALYTGLRKGAICALQWRHVDLKEGLIHLEKTKNNKQAYLYLAPQAVEILIHLYKGQSESEYVFPNHKGEQRGNFRTAWETAKKKAGIRSHIRIHDIRHTFGTYSTEKVGIKDASTLMTHSSVQMTEKYAHVRDQRVKSSSARTGDVFKEIVSLSNTDEGDK